METQYSPLYNFLHPERTPRDLRHMAWKKGNDFVTLFYDKPNEWKFTTTDLDLEQRLNSVLDKNVFRAIEILERDDWVFLGSKIT